MKKYSMEYDVIFLYPNTTGGLESRKNILERNQDKKILTLPCLETEKSVVQNSDIITEIRPSSIILSEELSERILSMYIKNISGKDENIEVSIFSKEISTFFFRERIQEL